MAEYHKITQEEAKARMDSGDAPVVLDVREPSEYEEEHIPGAVLLPLGSVADEAADKLPDKNQEILVYCRSGMRSEMAAKKLVAQGYTAVYDFGGIMSWPYETE
ncbi:MAG: rhodanese-like domain-containing protein [Eubacterium sp.]|nr:rhodanese-like domain-containing protein [Eubacterium sp.]